MKKPRGVKAGTKRGKYNTPKIPRRFVKVQFPNKVFEKNFEGDEKETLRKITKKIQNFLNDDAN